MLSMLVSFVLVLMIYHLVNPPLPPHNGSGRSSPNPTVVANGSLRSVAMGTERRHATGRYEACLETRHWAGMGGGARAAWVSSPWGPLAWVAEVPRELREHHVIGREDAGGGAAESLPKP